MNKTEAAYVNALVAWATGDPTTTTEQAARAAEHLAERATRTLSTAHTPAAVRAATTDRPHAPLYLGPPPPPAAVLTLLVGLWEAEDADGRWNGGDTVDAVCAWFEHQGIDPTHPAVSGGGAGDRERWDTEALAAYAVRYATRPADQRPTPPCPVCDGAGHLDDDGPEYTCDPCDGTGSSNPEVIAASRAAARAARAEAQR